MTWGYVAIAAGTVVAGAVSANGAKSAANKQAAAADKANQTQLDQYNQTRADNMPALEARNASLAKMRELLGIGGNAGAQGYGSMAQPLTGRQVQDEAGYQFGLQQGQQALQRQASARGMLNSGNALMAATRYGNDYASTKYQDAWNRLQGDRTNTFNRLASVAGYGQTGASQVGQAGANFANNVSANQLGVGNAQAAAGMAQSNAWGNAVNQAAGWYANQQRQPQAQGGSFGSNLDAFYGGTGGTGD